MLALLVLGGGSMCCSNIGAKFRANIYHIQCQFGWFSFLFYFFIFPLGQGEFCTQCDHMDLE